VFDTYPALGPVLPAVGYGPDQFAALRATIEAVRCDVVLTGTRIDLGRLLTLTRPVVRVRSEVEEVGRPSLDDVLAGLRPPS
jgi:predicted GTPase